MRYTALPIPAGYIVVETDRAGFPVLRNGAPNALLSGGVGQYIQGVFMWYGVPHKAVVFQNATDAELTAHKMTVAAR